MCFSLALLRNSSPASLTNRSHLPYHDGDSSQLLIPRQKELQVPGNSNGLSPNGTSPLCVTWKESAYFGESGPLTLQNPEVQGYEAPQSCISLAATAHPSAVLWRPKLREQHIHRSHETFFSVGTQKRKLSGINYIPSDPLCLHCPI